MILVLPPNETFVQELADNMRDADRQEIWASGNLDALDAVRESVLMSRRVQCAVGSDGAVLCMFGVVEHEEDVETGVPWMLSTDNVVDHPVSLVKLGRKYVRSWMIEFNRLVNVVHDKNEVSKQWLERIGFILSDPQEYGPEGEKFRVFSMERKNV